LETQLEPASPAQVAGSMDNSQMIMCTDLFIQPFARAIGRAIVDNHNGITALLKCRGKPCFEFVQAVIRNNDRDKRDHQGSISRRFKAAERRKPESARRQTGKPVTHLPYPAPRGWSRPCPGNGRCPADRQTIRLQSVWPVQHNATASP